MIFRDDDISHTTDLDVFMRIHRMFEQARVTHTVALIMENLATAPRLVNYLQHSRYLDLQLHCWQHVDLTTEPDLVEHLAMSMGLFMTLFRSQPTVLYPPWNKSNDYVVAAAKTLNLQVRPDKISLSQYIKVRGDVKEDTVNFHYWAPGEQILIEPALAIYNRQRQKA